MLKQLFLPISEDIFSYIKDILKVKTWHLKQLGFNLTSSTLHSAPVFSSPGESSGGTTGDPNSYRLPPEWTVHP